MVRLPKGAVLRRFFCESLPETGIFGLDETETHHLVHVLRADVGDEVEVFDGQDRVAQARVVTVKKKAVELEVVHLAKQSLELPIKITLATAMPKGDRQQLLVEKLVELGCARWIPLACERSNLKLDAKHLKKWQRWVIEASKQCGRNRLMEVLPPQSLATLANSLSEETAKYVAVPGGTSVIAPLHAGAAVLAIGPEGGWSDDEREEFDARGWRAVSLGNTILRLETAAWVGMTRFSGSLETATRQVAPANLENQSSRR